MCPATTWQVLLHAVLFTYTCTYACTYMYVHVRVYMCSGDTIGILTPVQLLTYTCLFCFAGWFVAPGRSESEDVAICCLDEGSGSLLYSLRIASGCSWTVSLRGVALNRSVCPLLAAYSEHIASALDVFYLLNALDSFLVCEGNSDEKFMKLSHSQKRCFMDVSGNW